VLKTRKSRVKTGRYQGRFIIELQWTMVMKQHKLPGFGYQPTYMAIRHKAATELPATRAINKKQA
jgi:hypothetical protein